MKCPLCKLENPPSAEYCDCGYEFVPGSKPKQWKRVYDHTPIIPAGLFTVRLVLWSWGMGIVTTVALVVLSTVSPGLGMLLLAFISPAVMYGEGHPKAGFGFSLILVCSLIAVSLLFGVPALLVLCGMRLRRNSKARASVAH
jgi:hypothetical protein